MKSLKKNLKYIMFGGIALALTACADDSLSNDKDLNNGPNTDNATLSTAKYTLGGGDQSRAWNYSYKGISTRSLDSKMPSYPTIPADAVDVTNYDENDLRNAGPVIKITGKHSKKINSWNNQTLYIAPGAQVECAIEGNLEVYILKDASFKFTGENISSISGFYNWGDFSTSGGFSLNSYPFYSANDVNINGALTFPSGANYYCEGQTFAKRITVNGNANVESCAFIVGDPLQENYDGDPNQWPWDAPGIISFDGGNLTFITSYLKAGYVKLNSNNNLHITIEDNGMVNTKYLLIDPKQNDQKFITNGSQAVVCANYIILQQSFQQNEEKLLPNFGVGVHLQDVTSIRENSIDCDPKDYNIPTGGGINNPDFSMIGKNCSPDYGDNPEPQPDPEPRLDLVYEVESPTHDHDIDKNDPNRRHLSASSLTFDGEGNIYASYHMRGGNWGGDTYDKDDIEGCIEQWTFEGDKITIGNWMWTNEFDFNHIILDGANVITVGHKGGKKEIIGSEGQKFTDFGGIIAKLPVSFATNNIDPNATIEKDDFQYKYLTTEKPLYAENQTTRIDYESAGDGNCVVRVEDKYFVATSAGYGVIDLDFKRIKDDEGNVAFVSTDGSTKYLVEDNGQVKVLYLNDRANEGSEETTSFDATLATMSSSAFPFEVTTSKMGANVSPVDGKNVIAVKDNVVYACLSKGGLQIGDKVISFEDENGVRSVNGVAVDNNYIYVANGSFLTVLDKTTHEKIVECKGNTKNVSANFVEVKEYNGESYIFVAFGQDGIKVFRLVIPGK